MLVSGRYEEDIAGRTLGYSPFQVGFHPAGIAPVLVGTALAEGRDPAGDDQTHAAFRALAEIRGQLWVIPEAVFPAGMHRTHHDAIAQAGEAQIEFGE